MRYSPFFYIITPRRFFDLAFTYIRGACMKKSHKQSKRAAEQAARHRQAVNYVKKVGSYWGKVGALLVFLLLWTWFVGDRTNWWFLDSASPASDSTNNSAGLEESSDNSGGTADGQDGSGGGSGGSGGNGGSGGGSGGGGSSTTTTNNTTTNTTNNTTNGGNTTETSRSLVDLFNDIQDGINKATLLSLAQGITPSCNTTQLPVLGTQEVCTFAQDGDAVIVTLLNGTTVSKVKVGF